MTLSPSSLISAVRSSHSTWSKGFTFAELNTRFGDHDLPRAGAAGLVALRVATVGARRVRRGVREDITCSGASIIFALSSKKLPAAPFRLSRRERAMEQPHREMCLVSERFRGFLWETPQLSN
jgi:hypothetical protein